MSRSTLQIKRHPDASLSWLITNVICVLDPHLRIRKRQLSDYYVASHETNRTRLTGSSAIALEPKVDGVKGHQDPHRGIILGTPNPKACKKRDMTHTCL